MSNPTFHAITDTPDDECNTVLTIDQGGDHWVIRCVQPAGHVSPHGSHIVWTDLDPEGDT